MEEVGDRVRRLRRAKGYSLARLEQETTYNRGYLSKIENGIRKLSTDVARHLDRALETDGELTRSVTIRPPAPEPMPADEDPWRLVLDPGGQTHYVPTHYAGAVGAGLLAPGEIVPTTSLVDERIVPVFEAQFETWRAMGHSTSPAYVLPGLLAQCVALRNMVTVSPVPDLLRTASRYAEYTGWMFQENGEVRLARFWTETAVRLAARVGDVALGSYALVRAAEIALYAEDGDTMVELARQAGATPGATAAVRSLAAQREAQGHALNSDLAACLSALDAAERWHTVAAGESGPHYGTTSLPDPITITRGWSMHNLARSEESAVLLTVALTSIPERSVRSRVRFGVRLARAQADLGDIEGACVRIAELVADLKRTDSATVRVDLKHLAAWLARHSGNPVVRDLQPEMRAVLRSRQ